MSEIVACPECQRKLQVPESYFGQMVQCPECQRMFVADPPAVSVQSSPPPMPPPSPELSGGALERRPRRVEDEEDDFSERIPFRRSGIPHRGGMILALGIIALVVMPCSTIVCGPMAWLMGNTDLEQMRNGMMDRDGEGMTQAGRILGIVATGLMVLWFAVMCLYFMFIFAVLAAHG